MDVGGDHYRASGGVHRVPLSEVTGSLYLCGLDVVGPDPAALLEHLQADTIVCLQTDAELDRRYPDYLAWLADPEPFEAIRLPVEDHQIAGDDPMESLIDAIVGRLRHGDGVVVHCGAGWGRSGLVGALVLVGLGRETETALRAIRDARPAAGPQSSDQDLQLERLAVRVRDRVALS